MAAPNAATGLAPLCTDPIPNGTTFGCKPYTARGRLKTLDGASWAARAVVCSADALAGLGVEDVLLPGRMSSVRVSPMRGGTRPSKRTMNCFSPGSSPGSVP